MLSPTYPHPALALDQSQSNEQLLSTPPVLPSPLGRYCENLSLRLSTDPSFTLASTICVIGAAIGSRCGIHPKLQDSWTVTPNVWGLLVGESGSGKTPAMSQPLGLLQSVERKLQASSFGKCPPRLVSNDATGEKLVELLRDNPGGLLLARDEIAATFEAWTRKGRQGERQLFLEAWNGTSPYAVDRIGRGSIAVDNLCMSILGTTQPDRLTRYLGELAAEDGLAQRFQLVAFPPHRARTFSDQPEDLVARHEVESLLMRLVTADYRALCNDGSSIPALSFSSAAYESYKLWWMRNAETDREPLLASFMTKHERLVPALALIDHLVNAFSTDTPASLSCVGIASIERAIVLSDFFATHTARVVAQLTKTNSTAGAPLLLNRLQRFTDGFTVREILRGNWSGLTNSNAVHAELEALIASGQVRVMPPSATGRPTTRYELCQRAPREPSRTDETAETAESVGMVDLG